ncbi:type II asparaginase [Helicobacter pametensis]|uniref:type II asparaginase n=1 Tax=Helicobacter pametensis TaxID=95149 RepID=UPI000488330A|nr:type II asparaginase [Helicobacter pametensis]
MKVRKFLLPLLFGFGILFAKPTVYILATGGTIAGAGSSTEKTASSYEAGKVLIQTILQALPKQEIAKYAKLKSEQVLQKGSQDLTPQDWIIIAKRVNDLLKQRDVDGIVITHGTDTIEETSMFLQLVIKSDKPVVLVGAMRPSTAISADGPKNLFDGIVLASSKEARGQGVMVVANSNILSASDITKTNPVHVDTFKPANIGILGYMWNNKPYFLRISSQLHTTKSQFDISKISSLPRVDILYGYAGMDERAIEASIASGTKGIVFAGVGNGNISSSVEKALSQASAKGIKVVRAGRMISGPITQWGEVNDEQLGFITSWWHTPQAARIILMLALQSKITDNAKIQELMLKY